MQLPKVSVLIVSYNVKQYIVHCIDSINKSDYSGDIEIIVVDNNSFDGSLTIIKQRYPVVKCIQNTENVGFGRAVNQAAHSAKGDYLLILNPDTVIEESTISTFVNYSANNLKVGMVGPKIVNSDGSLQKGCKRSFPTIAVALPKLIGLDKIFPKSKWAGRYNLNYLNPDEIYKVEAISGSCMFIKAELFNNIGGFDEQFFMFGEDLDLCYQVFQHGYEVHYLPTTQIMHYQGESVKSAPYNSINAFYKAMILFSNKHFSKSQSIFAKLVIKLGISVRRVISLLSEWRSQILSITFDALVVLLAFAIAFPLRFNSLEAFTVSRGLVPGVYILFWLTVCALFQLYSRYILSYTRAILASISGFFLAVVFTYFFKQYAFSRLVIIVATAIITLLIPGWRILAHYLMSRGVLRPMKERHNIIFTRKTLIIGTDPEALKIAKNIQRRFDTGLDIIGFSDHKLELQPDDLPVQFLGAIGDLKSIIRTHSIREIIFSTDSFSNEEILDLMAETKNLHLTYRMVPRSQEILLGKASVEEVGDYSFVNIEYNLFHRFHKFTKRIFDIIGSLILLILFSPITFIILFVKKIKKIRFWGTSGKQFNGIQFVSNNRFVNELLLLFSVLQGNISFVGSSLIHTKMPNPKVICKPGLTGLARIRHAKFSSDDREIMDHYYVQNQSLTLDLEIILKTLFNN